MGIEFGFNSVWDHNYISNTVETTTEIVRQIYHEPEIVLEVAEHAYEDFKDSSGPERARMLSSLTSNVAVGMALPTFGGMTKLGIFAKLHKVDLNISGKVAGKVTTISPWRLGLVGEEAVGTIGQKLRIPSLTGTAKYRIPDGLTSNMLTEVKNVKHLSLIKQIHILH